MGEIRCTLKQAQDGVAVTLDESTTIIVVPAVAQVTLKGRAFDAGKTFLLPRSVSALNEVFAFATRMLAKHAIVVGHVDAVDPDPDTLSETRAKLAAAWLSGDTAAWLDQYGTGIAEAQRWGAREDRYLLSFALRGLTAPAPKEGESGDPHVRAFQTIAKVKVDGIAGPVTRTKLIEKYFAASRVALLKDAEPAENGISLLDTDVVAHAASAHFTPQQVAAVKKPKVDDASPSPDSVEQPKTAASDAAADSTTPNEAESEPNARIDFFFFFPDSAPAPAPGAADGPEFLEWVKQTELQRVAVVSPSSGENTIFIELWDKQRFTRHRGRKYMLAGPESLSGVTDSQGRIEHDEVTPGDYTLTLTLEFFEGADKITDQYTAPAVVQAANNQAQVRQLGAVPHCELALIKGLLFQTNKAFLVPEAVASLKDIRPIYERHNGSELLVVGHTDTTATPSINDPLSLERAKSTLAYLQDDVDTWLTFYDSGVPPERRWGADEDTQMQKVVNDPSLARPELIAAYMALDGAELDAAEFQIAGTAHGCGENFPLDDSGEELDSAPADGKEDALDRRVELFFFDPEFGIAPKPAGEISKKGSKQYPQWRKLAKLVSEGEVGAGSCHLAYLVHDAAGAIMPNIDFVVQLPTGSFKSKTTADGLLSVTGVEPEEFLIEIANVKIMIASFDRREEARTLEVLPPTLQIEDDGNGTVAANQVQLRLVDGSGAAKGGERVIVLRADGSEEEVQLDDAGSLTLTVNEGEELSFSFPDQPPDAVVQKS